MVQWAISNVLTLVVLTLAARWLGRRRLGKLGLMDLLMINAIGDLASHTAYEIQHPVMQGLGSIVLWLAVASGMGLLAARWPAFRRFYYGDAAQVAADGRPDPTAMERLGIPMAELESELRKHGVSQVSDTSSVTLEPDGTLSVIKADATAQELRRLALALQQIADHLEETRPAP
ncbi:MAG TPA: YetF domain-containing protein [Symbiobacteriaceae bacterium]|nr:YetF domain-containing protein [Symbiobacteriaceae bacterium]